MQTLKSYDALSLELSKHRRVQDPQHGYSKQNSILVEGWDLTFVLYQQASALQGQESNVVTDYILKVCALGMKWNIVLPFFQFWGSKD